MFPRRYISAAYISIVEFIENEDDIFSTQEEKKMCHSLAHFHVQRVRCVAYMYTQ